MAFSKSIDWIKKLGLVYRPDKFYPVDNLGREVIGCKITIKMALETYKPIYKKQ